MQGRAGVLLDELPGGVDEHGVVPGGCFLYTLAIAVVKILPDGAARVGHGCLLVLRVVDEGAPLRVRGGISRVVESVIVARAEAVVRGVDGSPKIAGQSMF